MINTSAVNASGFLPESILVTMLRNQYSWSHNCDHTHIAIKALWISSREYDVAHPQFHHIDRTHQTHVYNPSSCPTVFQSTFPVTARFIAVFLVFKADVFMPQHTVRSIEVFHPNQTSFHLPDQTQAPADPLIQTPSKNVHLFLTVQPFSTYLRSPKNPQYQGFFTSSRWSDSRLHPPYSPA